MRDFLIPGAKPVGGGASGWDTDFGARQSRFLFKTSTDVGAEHKLNSVIELDFMVTAGGDERVSRSYTPRLRQAFFPMIIGCSVGRGRPTRTWARLLTGNNTIPDIVGRYNFSGDWSGISLAGIEYMYAERTLEDGRAGNLQKVQVSTKYSF